MCLATTRVEAKSSSSYVVWFAGAFKRWEKKTMTTLIWAINLRILLMSLGHNLSSLNKTLKQKVNKFVVKC